MSPQLLLLQPFHNAQINTCLFGDMVFQQLPHWPPQMLTPGEASLHSQPPLLSLCWSQTSYWEGKQTFSHTDVLMSKDQVKWDVASQLVYTCFYLCLLLYLLLFYSCFYFQGIWLLELNWGSGNIHSPYIREGVSARAGVHLFLILMLFRLHSFTWDSILSTGKVLIVKNYTHARTHNQL